MGYRKNIFKDRTFLAMTAVTVLATASLIGCGCQSNSEGTEDPSATVSDVNESNSDTDESQRENASDELESDGNDMESKARELATEAKDGMDEIMTDLKNVGEQMTSNTSDASEVLTEGSTEALNEAGVAVSEISFSSDQTIAWPVDTTDIIVDYSPSSTIYFATLDTYKTSDAIAIRSEVGTPVYAGAPATVADIGYSEEIGNFVCLDLGNNYTIQYGQVKDIQVEEGDIIGEGDVLCYVANPTKYYSVEGANLYLKLSADGTSVDPLDYLAY